MDYEKFMTVVNEMYDKSNKEHENVIRRYKNNLLTHDAYKELDTVYRTEKSTLKKVMQLFNYLNERGNEK